MAKRRIIRADALNWAIQDFQEGGDVIERGRYTGHAKQAKWKAPSAFYSTLADAARGLLEMEIAEGWTGEKLAETLEANTARVKEYLASLLAEQKTDLLIGILQERGYTISDGKKGRKSYADNDTPSEDDSPSDNSEPAGEIVSED